MRFLRALPPVLLVAAAVLGVAPSAGAAIASSRVTAPSDPTFAMLDTEAPSTLAVTGTVSGGTFGENVDLRCYTSDSESRDLEPNVSVALNGTFSAPAVTPAGGVTCRLRAVPAGTEPTELAPFEGPVLAVSASSRFFTGASLPYDFFANGQQLSAADDYVSTGDCGLADSYLRRNQFEEFATFFCNDFYKPTNSGGHPAESAFRVDGANSYFSANAVAINQEAVGFPPLTYSYSHDSTDGALSIADGESPVVCPDATYPPTGASCEEFRPSGVRDERSIEQTHDGHLVVITDRFRSTDGKAHAIEALPENEQNFDNHGEGLEYKFPGGGYALRAKDESVSFADAGPGAVYIKVAGAADGDPGTGRGAIVFFQPSSPAYFNELSEQRNGFYFDNAATVPATGTATIKYAYAQAFGQAEVEALVRDAMAGPAAKQPPIAPPTTGPGATSPAATFRIGKVQHLKNAGTLKMLIVATGSGRLSLTGKRVKDVSRSVSRKGSLHLTVSPTTALRKLMVERGGVGVTVNVGFAPAGGRRQFKVKKMRLVLNG